ncbi:MAG: DUF4019 domain-containing protein [Proteobacteria bacterium]|nr:MAG: DUF4019 domain-containing protein [Pseudomonadota bacterium]
MRCWQHARILLSKCLRVKSNRNRVFTTALSEAAAKLLSESMPKLSSFVFSTLVPMLALSTSLQAQPQDRTDLDVLIGESQAVLAEIDEGKAPSVWSKASQLMRDRVSAKEFVKRVEDERAEFGPVQSRILQDATRIDYPAGNISQLPAGNYVNIRCLATDGKSQSLQELISFRLEDRTQWRMTGYVAQKEAAK